MIGKEIEKGIVTADTGGEMRGIEIDDPRHHHRMTDVRDPTRVSLLGLVLNVEKLRQRVLQRTRRQHRPPCHLRLRLLDHRLMAMEPRRPLRPTPMYLP